MFRTIWMTLGGILTTATILVTIVIICCIGAGAFIVLRHQDRPGVPGTTTSHVISLPIAGPAKHTAM